MKTRIILAIASVLFFNTISMAADINVAEVRRNITLSDDDVVYKDYYLNAGEGSGLKKNLVVTVKRKINVRDVGAKTIGDFETPVGQLKIIQVSGKVAVAREYKLTSRDEEAMLEQIGILVGDRVDLTDSFIDNTKLKYKKSAAAEVTTPATNTASATTELHKKVTIQTETTKTTATPTTELIAEVIKTAQNKVAEAAPAQPEKITQSEQKPAVESAKPVGEATEKPQNREPATPPALKPIAMPEI